jgi:hypothetical protein
VEPWEKLEVVGDLWRAQRAAGAVAIRLQHPTATDAEVLLLLGARELGREVVLRATGRAELPFDINP